MNDRRIIPALSRTRHMTINCTITVYLAMRNVVFEGSYKTRILLDAAKKMIIFLLITDNVTRRESGSGTQKRVVCYYTNWSVYRPGTAKFSPQNINPYLCTHLIYAFGGLTRENSLRPYDKYQDIEQGTTSNLALSDLKLAHP
jgi:GH18 family chitinase